MAESAEEKKRRLAHNKQVRKDRKTYKDEVKDWKKQLDHMHHPGTELPKELFDIIEDIIKTQNKGVPLSRFQLDMLSQLQDAFEDVHRDESHMPKIVAENGETLLKDVSIIVDGKQNYTNIKLDNHHSSEVVMDLMPAGHTTEQLIEMIANTIENSSNLIAARKTLEDNKLKDEKQQLTGELLGEKDEKVIQKKKSAFEELKKAREDEFESDEKELELINSAFKEIVEKYKAELRKGKSTYMRLDNTHTQLRDVPLLKKDSIRAILHKGDAKETDPQSYDVSFPDDVDLVRMMPKNMTEQLIEILARALRENSRLHNQVYTADKIERKFPKELVGIITTIALVVAGAGITIANWFKRDVPDAVPDEPAIEDVVNKNPTPNIPNINQQLEKIRISPSNYYDSLIDNYLVEIDAYGTSIGETAKANDIYRDSVQGSSIVDSTLEYSEMYENFKTEYENLKQEYEDFYKQIVKKNNILGNVSVTVEVTQAEKQEYENLEARFYKLYEQVSIVSFRMNHNEDLRKILDGKDLKYTERDKTMAMVAGLSGIGVGAVASATLFMVVNAAKKEKVRELEAQQSKQEGV